MKISCLVASAILIAGSIFAAVYGLFSFDLLLFLCGGNRTIFRIFLTLEGAAGAWLLFWLIAFRPQNDLR